MFEFMPENKYKVKKDRVPTVKFLSRGKMYLNVPAVRQFKIKDGSFVELGYDRETKTVALKVVAKNSPTARKVNINGGNKGGHISARIFFNHFSIPHTRKRKFFLMKSGKMLTFCLKK